MRRRIPSTLVAALALLLAACRPAPAPPTPTPSPADYLQWAAEAMTNVQTVQFSLTREGTAVVLDPTLGAKFLSATGEYQAPDRVHASVKADVLGNVLVLEMLWLPEGVYLSNPFTGSYAPVQFEAPLDPIAMFSAEAGLSRLLVDSIDDPALVGTETIEGVEARHLTGSVAAEALQAMVPGTPTGSLALDVWLDLDTSRVLRLRVSEATGDQTTLDFFAYDEPVTIPSPGG